MAKLQLKNINGRFVESDYENAFISFLEDEGWQYLYGDSIPRADKKEVLYVDDLLLFLKKSNPELDYDDIRKIADTIRLVGSDSDFATLHKVYGWMVDGIQFKPKSSPAKMVPLIDFEHPDNNIFRVINQFSVEYVDNGETWTRRPDVLLYVNGMPVCVIELKNPADANATIYDAWEQINTRYWRDIPGLLHYCPLACISDGVKTRLGTVRTPYEHFYAWRRVEDGDKMSTMPFDELQTIVKGVYRPARFLEIFRDYIYFRDKNFDRDGYRGRTFIRIGPRRDIASAEEERILAERCAASLPTFDTRPCREARLEDIDVDTIVSEYLPKAIDSEVLANDKRPLKEQLASLHLFNMLWDCPTYAALIMFGRNPRYYMPGAYIQFVRFKGNTNGGEILNERRFEGCLYKILPELENFIRDGIVTKRPVPVSILREKDVLNYPYKALRELMMNAVMHRDYQSNMPTRLYQYDNHIEVMNPGGLYGQARPENFPHVNDYRNSVVAEMMKTLNYVNMFNHGVNEVQDLLKANGNPEAEFNVGYLTAFSVVVKDEEEMNCSPAVHELASSLSQQAKLLLISLKGDKKSVSNLQLVTNCSPQSKQLFIKQFIVPSLEAGLIERTHPDNPHHPRQKYYLTELGLAVLAELTKE